MTPARQEELRQIAQALAFESGFAGDVPIEAGMAGCLCHATTMEETEFLLAEFTQLHLDFARRYFAARDRNEGRTDV